jgi:UDPglucose 6-dehydrogenase
MSRRIAIVGLGHVGAGMRSLFPRALLIDPGKGLNGADSAGNYRRNAETCDLAIVCVPTPMGKDGACDTSIVERVVAGLESHLVLIKSTVTPGTCRMLVEKYGKRIVFSPEYMGESKYWTPSWAPNPVDPRSHGFMILGGPTPYCGDVADIFLPVLGPATRFRFMSYEEAELVKYCENAFFAMKVTFANQLRDICEAMGPGRVNYHNVREGWLDDPRVGPMHTAAFKDDRGFDGKCFPKDLAALRELCNSIGAQQAFRFFSSIIVVNEATRYAAAKDGE